MALKKTYVKSKNICRVTFNFPTDRADNVCLVGDFNAWNPEATPMKKSKQGFSATLDLEPGRDYQFRYLVNGHDWHNDNDADMSVGTPYYDAQNSLIHL